MFYAPTGRDRTLLPHNPLKAIVAPRPIGWISSLSPAGVANLAPYSFFNLVSESPDIVMFSSSGVKDTVRNILDTGEFVCNLATRELLAQVNEVPGIERVRFITSHPWDAVEELFDAMRDLPRVCEHLHLPVQSGSDRVLERMRRGYTAEEYLDKLELLRGRVPGVAVTTDLIVGFPGETEEDFEATIRLVKAARFDSAFIFSYSPRPFAAASRWEDDVPLEAKESRLQALLALQQRISREEAERQIGNRVQVLVEEPGMGRTRTNRKAYFQADDARPGELVNLEIRGVRGHSFMGKRC